MRYPGGKGQAGVYQRIINLMPPHDVYIETHLGGGNILERKKPAASTIAIDADAAIVARWRARAPACCTVIHGDAAAYLRAASFTGRELVYSDPPYVMSTRRSGRRYRHEYTDAQHAELLTVLKALPCRVMLSGYRCALYDAQLRGWYREDYEVMTRGGSWAAESLWLNFELPARLHDYRYLGGNFRERERIKRQRARWRARLARLPASEQAAMLEALLQLASPEMAGRASIAQKGDARSGARDPIAISGDAISRQGCALPLTLPEGRAIPADAAARVLAGLAHQKTGEGR